MLNPRLLIPAAALAVVTLFADTPAATRRLLREVRHELVMLPYYGVFDNLSYKVEDGKVTLLGQVVRPVLKDSAGRVVKEIEGVREVQNEIEVLPLSPNDDRIRLAAFRALYSHASLSKYALMAVPSIHIVVRNGNLTLEGVVANTADRTIAGLEASTLPGVFSVVNNLRTDDGH
ncbi:MAG: BON domain-containing protein [Paludibaculum sp.]